MWKHGDLLLLVGQTEALLAVLSFEPHWAVAIELPLVSFLYKPAGLPQLEILPQCCHFSWISSQLQPPLRQLLQRDLREGVRVRPDGVDGDDLAHEDVTTVSDCCEAGWEHSQPIARLRFFEDLPIELVSLREDLEALLGRTAG